MDDSVLDKPYAHYIALVGHYWSGKHHAVIKGINLITVYYTDPHGQHQPVNFRVYDKTENKTKNDYFLDMLAEVLAWGLEFEKLHDQHWQIEQYHRAIKQVCNIESFQVRGKTAVKNHLFAAIFGYVELQRLRAMDVISNCYKLRRDLFNEVVASFIGSFAPGMEHMNSKFQAVVNA